MHFLFKEIFRKYLKVKTNENTRKTARRDESGL